MPQTLPQAFEPTVPDDVPAIPLAQRLSELHGKRIGFVDNSKCNADLFIKRLCRSVRRSLSGSCPVRSCASWRRRIV